jgi:hypothetical protein
MRQVKTATAVHKLKNKEIENKNSKKQCNEKFNKTMIF